MPCIPINNGFICTNRCGRLHLPGKYIWVEFHSYCGPTFWQDAGGTKVYDAKEGDPIWPLFNDWLSKSVRPA